MSSRPTVQGTKRRRSKSDKAAAAVQGSHPAGLMRDSTLSAFHALGKFLYNKRVPLGEEGRGEAAAWDRPCSHAHARRQGAGEAAGRGLPCWLERVRISA